MTTHEPLLNGFLPIGLPSSAARVSTSLQYHATQNLVKRTYLVLTKVWTHTPAYTQPRPNHSTNPYFMINPTILRVYHDTTHSIYNYIKMHNLNNTQVAHIGLEPKSSHTIKVLSTTWASTFPRHSPSHLLL